MAADVSDDLELLLRERIESYEQLEVLLHLFSVREPQRLVDLIGALGLAENAAADAVEALRSAGLIAATSTDGGPLFRYEGAPELDATIRELAGLYREKPAEIAKRMTANAIERVRTAGLRAFSDAFRLRRRKADG
jgi:hypothetical protein